MAYLSPIPRKRDGKGAGVARILALTGRVYLARKERKRAEAEAAKKEQMAAQELAYERGQDARKEQRDEERLAIARSGEARAISKDEYQKERDAIADLYRDADLADKKGDNARADEYLRLAKERESRLKAEGGGGGGTQYDRGIALLEDLFVKNPVAPEQMPGRIPRILKLRAPGTKSPEDLAKLRETILYGLKPSPEDTEKGLEPIGPGIDTTYADDPRISKWVDQWLMKYADVLGIDRTAFLPSYSHLPGPKTWTQGDPRKSFTPGADDLDTLIDEELGP